MFNAKKVFEIIVVQFLFSTPILKSDKHVFVIFFIMLQESFFQFKLVNFNAINNISTTLLTRKYDILDDTKFELENVKK